MKNNNKTINNYHRKTIKYKFWSKYSNDGFKRLVNNGFVFGNTNYNYIPTYTAPGHTCIYTGTTSVFTQFSVTLNYASYTASTCDSAFISIYPTGNVSFGGYNWAHPNTKGIIDDLAWTFTSTAITEINKSSPSSLNYSNLIL